MLMAAAARGDAARASLLLDCGAKINAKDSTGDSALHWACSKGHEDVVRLLLDRGSDLMNCCPFEVAYMSQSGTAQLFYALLAEKVASLEPCF